MQVPPYETLAILARDVDPYAVSEHLQALGPPVEVAAAYDQLVTDAYWKHKDLPMVITLAIAGIHYCFTHAKVTTDDTLRAAFKSTAKGLAYNLGSFTWPGWDEPGILISDSDRERGLDAARLNLRLALELQKPFDKVCAASWLLGAHLLAAGRREEAYFHFRYAVPDPTDPYHALFHGYVLLAELLMGSIESQTHWNALIQQLTTQSTEAATFSRQQLTTAHRVFTTKSRSRT